MECICREKEMMRDEVHMQKERDMEVDMPRGGGHEVDSLIGEPHACVREGL
jgi:hypothetical protein